MGDGFGETLFGGSASPQVVINRSVLDSLKNPELAVQLIHELFHAAGFHQGSNPSHPIIHNNTSCSIIVETDDRSPTLLVKLPNGRAKAEAVTGSQDGARIDLHYLVQDRKKTRAAEPAYEWGDSVFTYEVQPGRSAEFGVPMSQFRKRLDVAVPFKYAWEGEGAIVKGVGRVAHRVYFLVEDVPGSALKRGQAHLPDSETSWM